MKTIRISNTAYLLIEKMSRESGSSMCEIVSKIVEESTTVDARLHALACNVTELERKVESLLAVLSQKANNINKT